MALAALPPVSYCSGCNSEPVSKARVALHVSLTSQHALSPHGLHLRMLTLTNSCNQFPAADSIRQEAKCRTQTIG
jgi:hypothetical protein